MELTPDLLIAKKFVTGGTKFPVPSPTGIPERLLLKLSADFDSEVLAVAKKLHHKKLVIEEINHNDNEGIEVVRIRKTSECSKTILPNHPLYY